MGKVNVLQAPRGGYYNEAAGMCEPASSVAGVHRSRQMPESPAMCMERPERVPWSTWETQPAYVRARNHYDAWLGREVRKVVRQQRARDEGTTMATEIAKLKAHRRTPGSLGGKFLYGLKSIATGALQLPFALLGAGCMVRSPYHGIGTPCSLVKIDLSDRAMLFRVLARNQIEAICRRNGMKFISKTETTTCREKKYFEEGTLNNNPNWMDGMARAVFDAASQYYMDKLVNFEVRDWRPYVRKIPVFFENCSRSRECAASVVVCLNEGQVKMLTKVEGKKATPSRPK